MSETSLGQFFKRDRYQEVIQSGEWKALARECRQRANNACEVCRRTDIELHVHHVSYNPDDPLLADELVVLCKFCHRAMHAELKRFRKLVFGNLDPKSFLVLNDALAVGFQNYKPLEFAYAMKAFVAWPNGVERFYRDWVNKNPKLIEGQKAAEEFAKLKNQLK